MPDLILTLDMLAEVRTLYGWGLLTGLMNRVPRTDSQLWRLEQYLIRRLERAGLAAPPDFLNDDIAIAVEAGECDYLSELVRPDFGGSD